MDSNYYHDEESVKKYIQMAEGVDGSALIEKLQNHLPKESSVLELGSGPGKDWRILSLLYDVVGSDYSTIFLKYLQKENPTGKFYHLDGITLKVDDRFDAIYSNKVLQHLSDDELRLSLKRQYHVLNDDGIICHSFWRGEGDEVYNGMFVNYQSASRLYKLCEKYFTILYCEPYQEFDENESLLLIAKKK